MGVSLHKSKEDAAHFIERTCIAEVEMLFSFWEDNVSFAFEVYVI